MAHLISILLLILFTSASEAKVFRNAYVSFEIADTWSCRLEQTEWVCRSELQNESREAIIILTAKETGTSDSFDAYTSHLNTPQPNRSGVSKIVYAPKQVKINDQDWIDGLHLGSEVSQYFTRYLITIKDRIAVLVTLSAHKDYYTKYSQDFFKTVQSLRVIATQNLLANPEMGPLRPGSETLGTPIQSHLPTDLPAEGTLENSGASEGSESTNLILGLVALILAIGGYAYFKMKQRS